MNLSPPEIRGMRERNFTVAFGLLLVVLMATSTLRPVGDGEEYLRLAQRIGDLQAPGGVSRHFWLYSALASPLVRAASVVGLNPLLGFALLNAILLTLACAVVVPRVGRAAGVLLMVSPILWWLDKAHTEAFTFALLAIGFALLRDAPWLTLVTVALAGTQNLPIWLALPAVGTAALVTRPALIRNWRWWAGVAAAGCVMAIALAYNLRRYGVVAPLLDRPHLVLPTLADIGVVLWDPNLGLLVNFPALAPVALVLVVLLLAKDRLAAITPEAAATCFACAAFVFGATQAANANTGGTPGMSRYTVWLIPLSIPILQRARRSLAPRALWWMGPVAAVSAVWSLAMYQPRLAERTGQPTALARYLWSHYPSLDNPLPEVFVERLRGLDEDWLPVATEGCEKILLTGRGRAGGMWPIPCRPAPLPAACAEPGRLCYANRTTNGYSFVILPERGDHYRYRREEAWGPAAENVARQLYDSSGWNGFTEPATLIETSRGVRRVTGLQSRDAAFVHLQGIEPGMASLEIRLAQPVMAAFIRPDTGETICRLQLAAGRSTVDVPGTDLSLILFVSRAPGP